MKEKFNDPTWQPPGGDPLLDSTLKSIDLPLSMRQVKKESAWKDGKRNAITVFKTKDLRIVLIALHKGTEMARHIADGIICVQVLEGKLQFITDQKSVELDRGQMLALHEFIPHSILAVTETVFLLTFIPSGKAKSGKI